MAAVSSEVDVTPPPALELDGNNEDLALAFEYQGRQHNDRVRHWQGNTDLEAQQARDAEKAAKCIQHGVALRAPDQLDEHAELNTAWK
jgi:hypothetical protein